MNRPQLLRFLRGQIAARRTDKSDFAIVLRGAVDILVEHHEVAFSRPIQNQNDLESPSLFQIGRISHAETKRAEMTAAVAAATVSYLGGWGAFHSLGSGHFLHLRPGPLEWAIVTAAFLDNVPVIQALLTLLPPPATGTRPLANPLRMAVRMGHYDVVRLLLDNGGDVNHSFPRGEWTSGRTTVLEEACTAGLTEIVELLLNPCYRQKISGPSYEAAILAAATYHHRAHAVGCNGKQRIIQILLERGQFENLPLLKRAIMRDANLSGCVELGRMMLNEAVDVIM